VAAQPVPSSDRRTRADAIAARLVNGLPCEFPGLDDAWPSDPSSKRVTIEHLGVPELDAEDET